MSNTDTIAVLFWSIFIAVFAFLFGIGIGTDRNEQEAVKAGAAEYTINQTNFAKEFHWKVAK